MSIYCSFSLFEKDPEPPYSQPYGYLKSHVLPSPTDDRAGYFDLGYIPSFIRRGGEDDFENEDEVWGYLRVSLRGSDAEPDTIVLDHNQVRLLRDDLNTWLNRVDPSLR